MERWEGLEKVRGRGMERGGVVLEVRVGLAVWIWFGVHPGEGEGWEGVEEGVEEGVGGEGCCGGVRI